MYISLGIKIITFNQIPLHFAEKGIPEVYYKKNNKTLGQTLSQPKYQKVTRAHGHRYSSSFNKPVGRFLQELKESGDDSYRLFLNKYGDLKYCEFSVRENLFERGIYMFSHDGKVKYVGRCTDSFEKRINYGYGKIYPKKCFIDGQATNCRLNSIINMTDNIEFGVYIMSGS